MSEWEWVSEWVSQSVSQYGTVLVQSRVYRLNQSLHTVSRKGLWQVPYWKRSAVLQGSFVLSAHSMKGWWLRSLTMVICPRNSVCQMILNRDVFLLRCSATQHILFLMLMVRFKDCVTGVLMFYPVPLRRQRILHSYAAIARTKVQMDMIRNLLYADDCALPTLNKRLRNCLTGFLISSASDSRLKRLWGNHGISWSPSKQRQLSTELWYWQHPCTVAKLGHFTGAT